MIAETDGGAGRTLESLHPFSAWIRRGGLVITVVGLLLGVGAGGAFAFWKASGTGSASATTGALSAVNVTAFTGGDAPTTSLLPGSTSDVILRVNNTNSYAVTLTSISLNGSITVNGTAGSCTTTGVSTTFPSSPAISVPAGSSLIHLTGAAAMSNASSNGCQGDSFAIPVSATFEK